MCAFACMNFSVPPGVCALIEADFIIINYSLQSTHSKHFIGPSGEAEALEGD